MEIKKMIEYAVNVNYCEGCEFKDNNKSRCMTCQHRDFWKTINEILNFQRKIQKITK